MKFLFSEHKIRHIMTNNDLVYSRKEAANNAIEVLDTNKNGQDFNVGKYDEYKCNKDNELYKLILENVKKASDLNNFDTENNDIGVLYASNSLMGLYDNIVSGNCNKFAFCHDDYVFVEDEDINIGYRYFIRREDIKKFIFDYEKKGWIVLTNYEGQNVDIKDGDCFEDPLFLLVKEWCVENTKESISTMSIDDYDVICFGDSLDELLYNIHNSDFYYANEVLKDNNFLDNRNYFIVINELNEHIAEEKKENLDYINLDFNYNKSCGLTIGQLEKMLDGLLKTGISRNKVLTLIKLYGD